MSWEALNCEDCAREAKFERVGRMDSSTSYGVSWLCPGCGARLLDVCFAGVDEPRPGQCLNCGGGVEAGVCSDCGLPREPLVAQIHAACGRPPSLAAVEEVARRGLVRLSLNALDLRLESLPEDGETWLAKARGLVEVGLLERSVEAFTRALRLGADPLHHLSLARILAMNGDHRRALEAFTAYLDTSEHRSHDSIAHLGRAGSLRALGRLDEAEVELRALLAEESENVQARVELHALLKATSRPEEALVELDLVLNIAELPNRLLVLSARAQLLCELERGPDALATVEEVLEHRHDDPHLRYLQGRALALSGQLERARESMLQVLALDSGHEAGQRALAQLDAALTRG